MATGEKPSCVDKSICNTEALVVVDVVCRRAADIVRKTVVGVDVMNGKELATTGLPIEGSAWRRGNCMGKKVAVDGFDEWG